MTMFGRGKSTQDPLTLMREGEHRKAAKLLELRLEIDPDDFPTKMRLAEAYEKSGRAEDACALYRCEGESLLSDGHRSEGAALLRKALRLIPDDSSLAERLAAVEAPQKRGAEEDSFAFEVNGRPGRKTEPLNAPEVWLRSAPQVLAAAFPELAEGDLAHLVSEEKLRVLESGEALVREGEFSDALYVVIGGSLRVEGYLEGENLTLSFLGPGSVVGEAAYLKGVPRTATVTAEEPSAALLIGGAQAPPALPDGVSARLESILEERVQRTLELVKSRFAHYQPGRYDADSKD